MGIISKTRGVKGEVVVTPLTPNLEHFFKINNYYISGQKKNFNVETAREFKEKILLKLEGIDSPQEARFLVGQYLEIEESDLAPLPEGEFYVYELTGSQVFDTNKNFIGKLEEIFSYPANDVFLIVNDKKRFYLPAAREAVLKIDQENKIIEINSHFLLEI